MEPDLADADPVAVCLEWLKDHPAATDLLGGPEHVSGVPEAPWPHVVVIDGPGGDMRDLICEGEFEVSLEVWGAPDGSPGIAALRRIAIRLTKILTLIPEQQIVTPTTPPVSRVRSSGVAVEAPQTNGQTSFNTGVMVTIRPPRTLPA